MKNPFYEMPYLSIKYGSENLPDPSLRQVIRPLTCQECIYKNFTDCLCKCNLKNKKEGENNAERKERKQ